MSGFTPPRALDRSETSRLLASSETHAFTLLTIALFQYGQETFEIDALELYARLHDDFGTTISQTGENRIQAILTAMTNDEVLEIPGVFDTVCKAITDGDPDLEHPDSVLDLDEMLWATFQMRLARGSDTPLEFGPMVEQYQHQIEQDNETQAEDELTYIIETLNEFRLELEEQLRAVGFEQVSVPDVL